MAEIEAEVVAGGWARTAKDLVAGAAGGIAQVLLGEFHLFFLGLDMIDMMSQASHVCELGL
jgi:hypothetical protein